MANQRTRQNDMTKMKRMADFVRGRTDIPRDMFRAAFPMANSSELSILTALGYLAAQPPRDRAAGLAEYNARMSVVRRAKKVAKLEAQLAVLREQEAAQ